jgi:predicted RNase H-like HicB family nuclease
MVVSVAFVEEKGGVWATVGEVPSLKAFGATREEAVAALIRAVESHYHTEVSSLQLILDAPKTLSNDQLRALATKHRPPQSWYEEAQDVLE